MESPVPSAEMLKETEAQVVDSTVLQPDAYAVPEIKPVQASPVEIRSELKATRSLQGGLIDGQIAVIPNAADSSLKVIVTLPEGLAYIDKSSTLAIYDPAVRSLSWRNLKLETGKPFTDSYQLQVNVTTAPVNLTISTRWRGETVAGESTNVVEIGQAVAGQNVFSKVGGVVIVSDRIRLDFPPDALKSDSTITAIVYAPTNMTSDVAGTKRGVPILPFELGPDAKFDKPVKVSVDLTGLISDPNQGYGLVVQNEYTETLTQSMNVDGKTQDIQVVVRGWRDLPTDYDPARMTLSAQLEHFSNYQVGLQQPADPKAWKFDTGAASVSLLRGSSNYAYPFYTPPMADGLQPALGLQYSSAAGDARANGSWRELASGSKWVTGRGWSLDMPKITRLVKRAWRQVPYTYTNPNSTRPVFVTDAKNYFTLELNGKTYNLIREGGQAANVFGGWYIPEDYAPIRTLRCNAQVPTASYPDCGIFPAASWGNPTGEYWHVFTPDGTRYVFGMDSVSANVIEQRTYDNDGNQNNGNELYNPSYQYNFQPHTVDTYAGSAQGLIVRTWFLRAIYAANRDAANNTTSARWSASYDYEPITHSVDYPWPGCNPCPQAVTDTGFRPKRIVYGNSVLTSGSPASTRYRVDFGYSDLTDTRLDSLEVRWGSSTLVRRYEMTYQAVNLGTER